MTNNEALRIAKEALQRAIVRKGYARDCGDPTTEREFAKEIKAAYDRGYKDGESNWQ